MVILAATGIDGIDDLVRRRGRAVLALAVPALVLAAIGLGGGTVEVLSLVVALGLGLLVVRHLDGEPHHGSR
jgi:hypothetical protein